MSMKEGLMKKSRLISLFAALAASLLVTSVPAGAVTQRGATADLSPARAPTLGPLNTKKHVTLTIWYIAQPAEQLAFGVLDKEFEKQYPNVTIDSVPIPLSPYYTKLRAAFAAKNGPDIVMQYIGTPTLSYTYALRPLADLVTPYMRAHLGDLAYDQDYFDPGLHTLPYQYAIYALAFNKKLFRAAGLNPSAPPSTLPALLSACDKLRATGVTPWALGGKDGWPDESVLFGGVADAYWTPRARKAWFNWQGTWQDSSAIAKGMQVFEQIKAHCFSDQAGDMTYAQADASFKAGKAAMEQIYGLPSGYESALGKDNVGVMEPPRLPGAAVPVQYLPAVAGTGWGITTYTHNCRWAWQWMQQSLFSVHAQEVALENQGSNGPYGGVVPNLNNIPLSLEVKSPTDSQVFQWLKSPYAVYGQGSRNNEEDTQLDTLLEEVVAGTLTPKNFESQMDSFDATIPSTDKTTLAQRAPSSYPACD
jgi:ABC-type glycerol-3-phosphate transport system substrate-binding protein